VTGIREEVSGALPELKNIPVGLQSI